jgi:glycosyltransferase involved in cell wall biosynthesis
MATEMRAMRVAIDATPLLGHRTGIGVAVDGFLRGLAGRPEVQVTAYGLTARGWRRLSAELPPGVGSAARPVPAAALVRAWARADLPPGEWVTGRAEVVHGTNFVVPPSRRAARVVSVWDLTAVRYPELCTPTSRRYPGAVARAVARGAWVHTAAESVAGEIRDHFGVDPARIRVVAPPVMPPGPSHRSGRPAAGPPYILALGRTEPRKELPTLVRAFDQLAGRVPDVRLRIAGPPGWAEDEVAAAVAGSAHRDRISRDGWVEDGAGLIAGAAAFAYPSLYEGFGLPPLEAMAMGVPVVATRAGALPEVLGPAAELVEPGDPAGLAAALERVLEDPSRRSELVRAGRDRAAGFSLDRAATGLIGLYRDAAGA